MNGTLHIPLFLYLICGTPCVFGADEDKVTAVSVKQGHAVTLHTDLTQMQGVKEIFWMFGRGTIIASTYGNFHSNHRFKDRLYMNYQTGSLTIKRVKTRDSGLYKQKTVHNNGTSYMDFRITVYGVDADDNDDEVKSVSVMEGDSVTLNPDFIQEHAFNSIKWWFKDYISSVIAETDGNEISYPIEEKFSDRLELDQTGSLTIRNMRTEHSGDYELQVDDDNGTSYQKFIVDVYESPSQYVGEAKITSVSVKEGDPVVLQTHFTGSHRNELVVWRFGDEGKLIAKHDIEAKSLPKYDTDERFRDRLKLDQTGSLTITNTRTTHSGLYKVKISNNKQTSYKTFIVTVCGLGLSPGVVAGICVALLLMFVAAAAGVIYYRQGRVYVVATGGTGPL